MEAYQSDLLAIGGRNDHGEPVYRLQFGNDPIRRPGGVLERPTLGQFPHDWLLLEWLPAEEFGSFDDWAGGPLGDYPFRGRYHLLQPFPGQQLGSRFLNLSVARQMAWISREHRRDSMAKRRAAFAAERDATDKQRQALIADSLQDAFPSFTGPTSFASNPTTRTAVQHKLEKLEDMERRGLLNRPRPRGQIIGTSPTHA
ncbi:MAG: hypothetical protein ACRD2E_08915 [Terriglobales bacterium]